MSTPTENRWDRISSPLQELIDQHYVPNFVVRVVQHGHIVFEDCMGWMDVAARKPVSMDTIFRIYSMTKPVTCTAMLMLFEEGKYSLDDPVAKYIPAFKDLKVYAGQDEHGINLADALNPITVRQLFTHTSGLGYGVGLGPVEDLIRQSGILRMPILKAALPLDQAIERLVQLPLMCQPGTAWKYSLAHFVLGHLVGLLSGMPFDEFLQKRIFDPLGMSDTAFWVPDEKHARFSELYSYQDPGQLNLIDALPASSFARPAIAPAGGEGLVSTVSDYQRFAQMLLNGGSLDGACILSRKTIELMTSNHLTAALLPFSLAGNIFRGWGYGLGAAVLMDRNAAGIPHSNGTYFWRGAAGTSFFVDPQEGLIGILMTQLLGLASSPTPAYNDLFEALVYSSIG
jgi:CubicO group peptidase (beta-lactamase class C family)